MNSGIYAACAGLVARSEALDTIASNIANSSSSGFRAQQDVFGTVLEQASHHGRMTVLNTAANTYSHLASTKLDQSQGVISHTGNELDVAIQGAGYFKIQTPTGIAYTRNGHFRVDAKGQLTTDTGNPVLGAGGPILLNRGAVSISPDGTISSGGAISGKLSVVTFAPGAQMTNRGGSDYVAPSTSEIPATGATLQQGALESSNVSPIEGMVNLISAQRAQESMRHALSLLDTDMNKTAVQDLAHVG